ncbi:hypothetical protein PGT21_033012 [Puccinia graminis f. sp. tritici]|uniref:Uncharacterized protein n=1 Tax=Puccinia graminis f. sp. tritici TaxID=56615 RepID=A0A5B0Q8P0_PUCGR|nr:hypothetical protein PGT21_033012 [Puccinia graminis f. sp. tritici]KAA1109363.1 hypothetical protein PGTUg99_030620 [Puccinia graminis f. sp. tritici]
MKAPDEQFLPDHLRWDLNQLSSPSASVIQSRPGWPTSLSRIYKPQQEAFLIRTIDSAIPMETMRRKHPFSAHQLKTGQPQSFTKMDPFEFN